jgi:hypothetical protein
MPISTIGQNGLNAPLSLTTPNLGTPSALVLTNATALPRAALPTGSLLQVVNSNITSSFSTSSSSYTFATNHTISITTTVANSKIVLFCNTPLQLQTGTILGQNTFRSSIDSYTANLGETVFTNYNEANAGWKQATTLQTVHSPAQALGTTITYRVYIRAVQGGTVYFPDSWGLSFSFSFMAMEIAP